jgi:hypothetical protein
MGGAVFAKLQATSDSGKRTARKAITVFLNAFAIVSTPTSIP